MGGGGGWVGVDGGRVDEGEVDGGGGWRVDGWRLVDGGL